MDDYSRVQKDLTQAQVSLAQKSPIMEAEFALDDRTPLSLFDCLLPMLKEQRRYALQPKAKFSIEDFRAR